MICANSFWSLAKGFNSRSIIDLSAFAHGVSIFCRRFPLAGSSYPMKRKSRRHARTNLVESISRFDKRDFARLLAVTLAKVCIRAKTKRKPKHASGDLFRKGRMASAKAVYKRVMASGVMMRLAMKGCGLFCCSKRCEPVSSSLAEVSWWTIEAGFGKTA